MTPDEDNTVGVPEIAIRAAEADDAVGIATVHSSAWRTAFTFLPAAFLDAMTPQAVLSKWQDDVADSTTSMFVAIGDAVVVGFLQVRAENRRGEVMSLYVDPSRWRQSVGASLLAFGEDWLMTHGTSAAVLWTAKQSRQSREFYEHRGWEATGHEQTHDLAAGVALHEVEYRKALA